MVVDSGAADIFEGEMFQAFQHIIHVDIAVLQILQQDLDFLAVHGVPWVETAQVFRYSG